jgi:non-specific protein-tyrosine kinase
MEDVMAKQPNLITLTDPRSPAAEAYRTLRTNLYFSSLDQALETLLVTSAASGEGKSTILSNLAVTMAQGEKRTILVDADLRRPSLHNLFDAGNNQGLTTMVVDESASAEPPLVETGVENLLLLPSGPLPPNPAEILGSRRMEEIIATLKTHADIVLFDAPPVMAVTDAAVLGTKVDGVLLVFSAGKTRREHAVRAKEVLERVQVRLIGAVLNNAPPDQSMGAYYAAKGNEW